jgi:hypothetical protein
MPLSPLHFQGDGRYGQPPVRFVGCGLETPLWDTSVKVGRRPRFIVHGTGIHVPLSADAQAAK